MTYRLKFTTAYKKSYNQMKRRGLDISLLDDVLISSAGERGSLKNTVTTVLSAVLPDSGNVTSNRTGF